PTRRSSDLFRQRARDVHLRRRARPGPDARAHHARPVDGPLPAVAPRAAAAGPGRAQRHPQGARRRAGPHRARPRDAGGDPPRLPHAPRVLARPARRLGSRPARSARKGGTGERGASAGLGCGEWLSISVQSRVDRVGVDSVPVIVRRFHAMAVAAPPFAGFRPEAIQFLVDLAANNERSWFQPRKGDYERLLKEPLEAFVAALGERLSARRIPLKADPTRAPFR